MPSRFHSRLLRSTALAMVFVPQLATAQDQDTILLDTVVIQGARQAETGYVAPTTIGRTEADPVDVPLTVTTFTADRIEDQDIRTDVELLQQTPGVDITSLEGFNRVRGYDAQYAIDGVPVGAFVGRTSADLSAFEQVEVLKGPAAIFQGSGGLGGMINYNFKRPFAHEALHTRLGFADPSAKSAMIDYNIAPLMEGRLRARFVASYEDRDFDAYPEGYDRLSLFGVTEFDATERTVLRFSAWRQTNDARQGFRDGLPAYTDGGLIDFPAGTTSTQDWALYEFRSLWLNAEIEHEFNDRWKLRLSYRNGDSHHPSVRNVSGLCTGADAGLGYEGGIDRDHPDGRACYDISFWNDWNQYEILDANLNGAFDAFGRTHEVLFGATRQQSWFRRAFGQNVDGTGEYVHDIFNPNPHVIDQPSYVIDDPWGPKPGAFEEYQVFGQINLQVTDRLSLPIGGRMTWIRTDTGEWTAKGEFTPSIAAVYKLNDNTTVYAQFARVFQANTYAYGWNPDWTGDEAHELDEGNLLPNVTGTQREIGIKSMVFGGAALATAAVFEIEEVNRPRNDTNPSHVDPAGDRFQIASGTTRSRGLEFGLNGEIRPGWKIGIGYAYIDAKYISDDQLQGVAIGTSRHSGNIWTNYTFADGRLDGVSIGGGLRFKSSFQGDPTDSADTNRVKAPGYGIVSARVGYDISERVNASVNVDNLFDKKYYAILGDRGYGNYYGDQRRISFNLNARF